MSTSRKRKIETQRKYYAKNREKANLASKLWYRNNRTKVLDQNYKQYGFSYSEYVAMFAKQNGLCALCGEPPTEKLLVVDHNHQTNKVRGLLHRSCNSAIGILGDNVEGLERALKYLKENS